MNVRSRMATGGIHFLTIILVLTQILILMNVRSRMATGPRIPLQCRDESPWVFSNHPIRQTLLVQARSAVSDLLQFLLINDSFI